MSANKDNAQTTKLADWGDEEDYDSEDGEEAFGLDIAEAKKQAMKSKPVEAKEVRIL
jgi:hypothetical protein